MKIPGCEHHIKIDDIVAIIHSDSASVKRLRHLAAESRKLINTTKTGEETKSLIILKNNDIVFSTLTPETLKQRIHQLTHFAEK